MQRGSDKHGPRIDEALEHETEGLVRSGRDTHAEEWKSAEPSGEDQPEVDLSGGTVLQGGVPDGMTAADVEERSRIATYLGRQVWPATGHQLVSVARAREAPDAVVARLSELPPERSFGNLQEAWVALSGGTEAHRS